MRNQTARLKNEALKWLRFEKRYNVACTELRTGLWIADVFGLGPRLPNPYNAIEIEVKISMADLRNDFKNKAQKHLMYLDSVQNVPNYMYFMVPPELVEQAQAFLATKNPKYGIITSPVYGGVQSVKIPKKLHSSPPSDKLFTNCVRRMGNELVTLYGKMATGKGEDDTETDGSEVVGETGDEHIPGAAD